MSGAATVSGENLVWSLQPTMPLETLERDARIVVAVAS
jgi:hypothetical protein